MLYEQVSVNQSITAQTTEKLPVNEGVLQASLRVIKV